MQTRVPIADFDTSGWASLPLWSKVNEGADSHDGDTSYIFSFGFPFTPAKLTCQAITLPGPIGMVKVRLVARGSGIADLHVGLFDQLGNTIMGPTQNLVPAINVWTLEELTFGGLEDSADIAGVTIQNNLNQADITAIELVASEHVDLMKPQDDEEIQNPRRRQFVHSF